MINIVFGLVAICLAIWGLVTYWWYTVDVIIAIFPLALLFFGIVALLAGIKNTGLKATVIQSRQAAADPAAKKKDE
jgi:vacuolar-type H+-ATPase subunit I/STV1